MARSAEVAALEAQTPWTRASFRDGLATLTASTTGAAQQFARDASTLAYLAAQVPRRAGDESGSTPWTSFRREIALARSVSDQAAAAEVRTALRLTSVLPHTLDLLHGGRITVARARVFVDELQPYDDAVAGQLDCDLAADVARLAPWRIRELVRRAVLALDPDAAAVRTAQQSAARGVTLEPQADGQACVVVTGPAVPLTRWHATLDARARALRAAGDPRNLDALRFDLTVSAFPCTAHSPASNDAESCDAPGAATGAVPSDAAPPVALGTATAGAIPADDGALAGSRLSGVEPASTDCRMSRPVQAMIVVPVETALGLSNEPAWLDGYGWIDAPTSRTLLVDAELRRVCADRTTGQPLDLAPQDLRPPPSPQGVHTLLVDIIRSDITMTDTTWRHEAAHDPSDPLRRFTTLRDRTCDGPTQTRTRASTCDLDHDQAWPLGPTAAWNLVSRSRRTHGLKHLGWTPLRTATSTIWTSPAGQVVDVPRAQVPPPGVDHDPTGRPADLPDPDELADLDHQQLTATDDDLPPWLPAEPSAPTTWAILDGSDDPPF